MEQLVLPKGLFLEKREDGLVLTDNNLVVRADLTTMIPRLKYNNLTHELLVKAAKIKNPDHELLAVDATAGFGEDSLLLAASGFRVVLFEYNPIIAALLEDALQRAASVLELAPIVSRMKLVQGDSIEGLKKLQEKPDVVYLDPMFPERNKSALIKKKFQLLQQLERPCGNEEELVKAAIAAKPHKIVIKRPAKGPFLSDIKPSFSVEGKAVRYDCLVF